MSKRVEARKTNEYKICVCGGSGVGKTVMTDILKKMPFTEEHNPTTEETISVECQVDGQSVALWLLDTSGNQTDLERRTHYLNYGHGYLLVYSVADRSSFDKIPTIHRKITAAQRDSPTKISWFLVGNKCDREAEREITEAEGRALATSLQIPFLETSAKTGMNVELVFHNLVRQIREDRHAQETKRRRFKKGLPQFFLCHSKQPKRARCPTHEKV
eukprot:c6871_g1_i1.p1 GENE.c6871_g1_i1~~c6871_g1_i1.p1  ORF type:complete len:216 (+),score=27.69 c6871_g1_i1:97-744(+)